MSDRLRRLDDEALGQAIRSAGERWDWPREPTIAHDVVRTIQEREGRPFPQLRLALPRPRRVLVLAVLAVVVLAAAALAAKLIIDLGAITVEVVPGRPTSLPHAPADRPISATPSRSTGPRRSRDGPPASPGPWDRRTACGSTGPSRASSRLTRRLGW